MFACFLLRICLDLQNRVCLLPGYINESRITFVFVCYLDIIKLRGPVWFFRNLDIQHEKIIQTAKGSSICVLIHHRTAGFSEGWQESNGWGNSWHCRADDVWDRSKNQQAQHQLKKLEDDYIYSLLHFKKSFLLKKLMELHCYVLFTGGNQCDQSSP